MPDETQQTGERPVDFDKWFESQADDIKSLVNSHIQGLKTALDSERESRKSFEKQVRDLATKVEAGSEAQKQLTALADQVGILERRQSFYDEAHSQGVSNLKLAYLAASDAGLIDDKGRVNWEQLKKSFPQLFGAAVITPKGNAGDGTSVPPGGKASMNTIIRRAAGQHD